MTELHEHTVMDVTDNFDKKRIPLSAKQRKGIAKIFPYYGAQSIIDYVDDYLFDGEYILVAEDGENLNSQNSNVCNLVNGKFWVNNHAHIIRAKEEYNTKYLCYYLNLLDFKPFVTGSAQPKLTKDNLNAIPLVIHGEADQNKIAKVLSSLDKKIELNNKINTELEAMAKLIYDYWFVQFDFPDANGKPYKSSGGKMVYNEELKREIPDGWGCGNVDSECSVRNGYAFKSESYTESGYTIVRTKNFKDGSVELGDMTYISFKEAESFKRYNLEKFDFLLVMVGASVGKNVIVNSNVLPALQNQNMWCFRSKLSVQFFTNQLMKRIVAEQLSTSSGSAREFFKKEIFKKAQFSNPSVELKKHYCEKVNSIFNRIDIIRNENQKLAELRDWLLPMLMNGQVIVKD